MDSKTDLLPPNIFLGLVRTAINDVGFRHFFVGGLVRTAINDVGFRFATPNLQFIGIFILAIVQKTGFRKIGDDQQIMVILDIIPINALK